VQSEGNACLCLYSALCTLHLLNQAVELPPVAIQQHMKDCSQQERDEQHLTQHASENTPQALIMELTRIIHR
jgi:hypothetical protein